ncbi:MAG: DUF3592 domain-containing protein [Bryobacterales bacterium]|nr:DUF3592 domain-containing protein [Bryobacterales bacterium]
MIFGFAGVILSLVGLPLVWLGAKNAWLAVASSRWPVTEGVVRSSSVSTHGDTTAARIVVAYRVNGTEHTTGTLHFGQTVGSSDSSDAQLRALRYASDSRVWVHYNDSNPAVSCLEPGFHAEALLLPIAGLVFGIPGGALLVAAAGIARRSMWKHALYLFAASFGAAGAAMLWVGLDRMWRAHASANWPETPAEIVYAREDRTSSHRDSTVRRGPASMSYATNLVFRYSVDGQTHYSNLRRIGQIAGASAEWAAAISGRYPKGVKLTVRYMPGNPSLAVIEPGIGGESCWLPAIGAAFLLFGFLVAKFGIPALMQET